jgi:hypothetical protein
LLPLKKNDEENISFRIIFFSVVSQQSEKRLYIKSLRSKLKKIKTGANKTVFILKPLKKNIFILNII